VTSVGPGGSGAGERDRVEAARASPPLSCNRCGFAVPFRTMGCKNPCPNCGTVYPLGDCSD
jgi:predicted RNA-binding Zn-ribbon protein involved in translation (DUF1610 family)